MVNREMPAVSSLSSSLGRAPRRFPNRWNTFTNESFITKYNPQNQVVWTTKIHWPSPGNIRNITVDNADNIYVTGLQTQSGGTQLDYVGGEIYNATGEQGTIIRRNYFVSQYRPSGRLVWTAFVHLTGGIAVTDALGIAVYPLGGVNQIYVTGKSTGGNVTATSSNGAIFGTTLTNIGGTDGWIVRFNDSGITQFIAKQGSTTADTSVDVTIDTSHGIYITGSATGTYALYNNAGTSVVSVTCSGQDVCVGKYISDLTPQWIGRISTSGTETGYKITSDSSNNVYVTGQYAAATCTSFSAGNVAFSPTLSSLAVGGVFLVKFNSNGAVQWNARMGSTTVANVPFALKSDTSGNTLITGSTGGTFRAYNANGTQFATTSTRTHFVAFYNTSGAVQWVAGISGSTSYASDIRISGSNYYLIYRCLTSDTVSVYTTSDTLHNSYSGQTFIIIVYNSSGVIQNVLRNTSSLSYGEFLTIDSTGSYYVAGATASTALTPSYTESLILTQSSTGQNDGLLVKYNTNGKPIWSTNVGSSNAIDTIYGVTTDSSGNIYACGQFGTTSSTITVRNASGTTFGTYTVPGTQASLGLLIKYDSSGNVLWVINSGLNVLYRVTLDSTQNVYTTGVANATTTIRNADGTTFLSYTLVSGTSRNGLLIKSNSAGTIQWVRNWTASASVAEGRDVKVDSADNVYITGFFGSGTLSILNTPGGTAVSTLACAGGVGDAVIIKWSSAGSFLWRAKTSATSSDAGYSLAIDSNNNVYMGGKSVGGSVLTAFNSNDTAYGTTLSNTNRGFITRWNSSGTVLALIQIIGPGGTTTLSDIQNSPFGLITDRSGNLYVAFTGGFTGNTGTVSFTSMTTNANIVIPTTSSIDAFLAKYNNDLSNVLWVRRLTGSTSGTIDAAYDVTTDRRGNPYLAVSMINPAGSSASSGIMTSTQGNVPISYSTCLLKYDANGTLQWFPRLQGSTTFASGYTVATDFDNNIILGGRTAGSASVTENTNLYYDVFTNLLSSA